MTTINLVGYILIDSDNQYYYDSISKYCRKMNKMSLSNLKIYSNEKQAYNVLEKVKHQNPSLQVMKVNLVGELK